MTRPKYGAKASKLRGMVQERISRSGAVQREMKSDHDADGVVTEARPHDPVAGAALLLRLSRSAPHTDEGRGMMSISWALDDAKRIVDWDDAGRLADDEWLVERNDAAIIAIARALLSISASERGLREALEKIAAPMTADEIAEKVGETILSICPRLSELVSEKYGRQVEKTKERRKNISGCSATVWRLKEKRA